MSKTITLTCPAWIDEDEICGALIEVDAWHSEPMTHWYPGSPPGFEVVNASCGHAGVIEDKYYDYVMQQLAELELDTLERAAERRYERLADEVQDAPMSTV
jgi:hypothetical protein